MPMRKLILILVALLVAGGTTMMVLSMKTNAPIAADSSAPVVAATMEVLAVTRDMPAGTLIKDADLKWMTWPSDASGNGFVVKGKEEMSAYIGAVVRQGLRSGEPIMAGRVARVHDQSFMAAVLNPGMRAVAIQITPTGGVAGFVSPGDHVDVIVTRIVTHKSDASPDDYKISEIILRNVRVLALDQKSDDLTTDPKIAQTATLEVTPKQAQQLSLTAQLGTLSLALRSVANDPDEPPSAEQIQAAQETAKQAVGHEKDAAPTAAQENRVGLVQQVHVMRGKDVTVSTFEIRP